MAGREDVEFKTVDGLTLRGWLYPAAERGPGVILTPGFNFTKETIVSEIAEYFQRSGFTALSYDPRSIGSSDGQPRNEIAPARNVEDYHDAVTFLRRHPRVDAARGVALWGYSFSATVALAAAALDRRPQAVVAMCPFTQFDLHPDKRPRVLARAMQDREARTRQGQEQGRGQGRNDARPVYVPMLTEAGKNPAGFGGAAGYSVEHANMIAVASRKSKGGEFGSDSSSASEHKNVVNFEVPTTLSSYYHIAAWQPLGLMAHVSPTPVLVVTPEKDLVSPAEKQKELIYDVLTGPKRLLVVPGKGHMDVLAGDDYDRVLDAQVAFLREVMTP